MCLEQGDDKGLNMSRKYNNVQTIFSSLNPFEKFSEWGAHSLNFVDTHAVECREYVLPFFPRKYGLFFI